MGILGALAGAAGGFIAGGPVGAVVGAVGGYAAEESVEAIVDGAGASSANTLPAPPQVDYSAVMVYQSDNNKTVALAQITAQEFALQQASVDRQLQLAANLELGLEKLDTNLQTSRLAFVQQMTVEADKHEEKMAQYQQVFSTHSNYDGLPPPEAEEERGF